MLRGEEFEMGKWVEGGRREGGDRWRRVFGVGVGTVVGDGAGGVQVGGV